MTARAKSLELAFSDRQVVDKCLGHDRPRRVARTEKEDIQRSFGHPIRLQGCGTRLREPRFLPAPAKAERATDRVPLRRLRRSPERAGRPARQPAECP